jgi:amino acid adenylation domain-containing protein
MSELLQDYSRDQAERDADSVALVMGHERVTYGQLERASNQVARQLAEAGCRRGDRVCLFVEKSPAAISAMVGTLKAGCAYVPVDVASPAPRLARIVAAADPAVALVSEAGVSSWAQLCASGSLASTVRVGALDASAAQRLEGPVMFGPAAIAAESTEPLTRAGRPDDLAHILFTSGSTGAPKGVMITHANVRAFVEWAVPYFDIRAGDRVSGHPPLHFDLATFDVYGSHRAGAELHVVPGELVLPRQLAAFITTHELVQWFSVPSAMTYMARFGGLPETGFPSLRRILWCGEVLPTPVLIEWMQRVPQARFTNLYGPTEATIASSYHTTSRRPDDVDAAIPIGRACDGEELFVLGEDGRRAPPGELGEIHIAGVGLSPGYWRDERSTELSFVSDPRAGTTGQRTYRTGDLGRCDDDGTLHFAGRRDAQIKSRGYRIELGEIEAAVSSLSGVGACAVVAIAAEDFAGTTICCAYVPSEGGPTELTALRARLRELLPTYMLPSRWHRLDVMPTNSNGKIDRRCLTEMFADHGTPRTVN